MLILGINAFHGDSSACLIKNGGLIAAVEEERFRRVKHWAGFPSLSIRYCLEAAGAGIKEVDFLAVNRRPWANLHRKALFVLSQRPGWKTIWERMQAAKEPSNVANLVGEEFHTGSLKARTYLVEHHKAHLASSFLVSPFEQAALLSVDGFGDFVSTMGGLGKENSIQPLTNIFFPHSLGVFYTAITQFLGFKKYGDEFKVMGLAALGKPEYLNIMQDMVRDTSGGFALNLQYFKHHQQEPAYLWEGGEPSFEDVYSFWLEKTLGPARSPGEPLEEKHANLAASLQARYEEVFFRVLNSLYEMTKTTNLCLAGGCALNSVANGKIFDRTPFREIYIQPAAYDGGGCLGAAYYVYHSILGHERRFVMKSSYWGPEFTADEIEATISRHQNQMAAVNMSRVDDENELVRKTAQYIADGKIIGWFQGRMEWGPRALGNRSIIVDPRRAEMKDILNARIKRREPFRPFAPSILQETTSEYFEKDYPDPFMIKVYPIKEEKRQTIPAVTHVDGSGRLQTVSREENPLYYRLIEEFGRLTGVPVVLNTSFNENEPIVCTPEEALSCFLRTRMDVLVMGPFVLERDSRQIA